MKFRHKTPIQIRFKDVDKLGHVNNANHLTYLESARIAYFKDVVGKNISWTTKGIILARAEVDYKAPIMLDDKLFVYTCCSWMGNKSFSLDYSIVKEENAKETELAAATTVIVCFDYEIGKSMAMPQEWKEKMEKFENKT
jgi:acyl-CoA thioester hydrolase